MGFAPLDYFTKCDPLELHFRLLLAAGFWPPDTKSKIVKVLYSIYGWICLFPLAHIFFVEILDIYLIRNDLKNVTKNLCATSVSFACVFKQVIIFSKIENLKKLYKKLEAFKMSLTDPGDLEILEKADRVISLTTKAIFSLGVSCITTWMLYPALESGNQKHVPFPYRLPTDDWSTPVYELVYTFHSFTMIGYLIGVISNDMVYYGMVIRINAKYDILFNKLKTLESIADGNEEVDDDNGRLGSVHDQRISQKAKLVVKDCCVFHQTILEEIEELKVVYGKPYLVHFIAAVILIGAIIMDVIVVSKGFKLQLLQRVMYTATGIFDTYLCCFFTTAMQEKSYQLSRSVYSTPWYKLNPEVRKYLLLMSMRSIKPPAVKVGNIFPLNLATFLHFLKLSYNITALLYQTIER